jgi:HEAT repeat protein
MAHSAFAMALLQPLQIAGVLAWALVSGAGMAAAPVALADLADPDWSPDRCTASDREKLLNEWQATLEPREISNEEMERLFRALGDESYAIRQAAATELALRGESNADILQRLSATDGDPERIVRANEIMSGWRNRREKAPVRMWNLFRVWAASSHELQLAHVRPLVAAVQNLPAEYSFPEPHPVEDWGEPLELQQRTIRLHEGILPEVTKQMKGHKTRKADELLLSFLREPNPLLVTSTIWRIGSPDEDLDVAPELIRLAEGSSKDVALAALSALSNWSDGSKRDDDYREAITAMLKRLYGNKDEEIALQAAIISCYSGDGSGFPMVLEAARNPDKKIARKAIGQLGCSEFAHHAAEIVPVLIPFLETDDPDLLNRVIESFGNFKGEANRLLPFLSHEKQPIVVRTIVTLGQMGGSEAIKPLKELRATTTDESTLRCIDDVLVRLEKPRP